MMTTVDSESSFDWQAPLRLGSLLRATWRTMMDRPCTFLGVSLLCAGPGQLAHWLELTPWGELTLQDVSAQRPFSTLLTSIGAYIGYSALVQLSMRVLAGRQMTAGQAMERGVRGLLRVLWANIGYSVLVVGGLLLFVVPGIILALACMLAPAVAVVESKGMRASLRRSRELTRGYRGRLLVLMILVSVIFVAPALLAAAGQSPVGLLVVRTIHGLFSGLFLAVFVTNIYARLRAVHDGKAAYVAAFR